MNGTILAKYTYEHRVPHYSLIGEDIYGKQTCQYYGYSGVYLHT